jgi:hypothetical protein
LWGTLLADIVIQMLGTDYARIVQAIYAFAQVKFMLFSPIFSGDALSVSSCIDLYFFF